MPYEIIRFPYDGTLDADGHVLEPDWLWSEYLEERYRDRALRIRTDAEGLEYLELDGRASERTTKGVLGLLGAMGDLEVKRGPDRRYMDHIPFGGGDAKQRIALLDQEHLEKAVLYPTIGLLWECELDDPVLTLAYQRAYNRWIADFCRDSGGRLVPIAQLSLLDPAGAAAELERAVRDGCRWIGAFLDRMDAVAETVSGRGARFGLRPSELFRRQCFISGDPDETAAPLILDHVGADCFLWATDYPHPDHPPAWARALERFVAPLAPVTRDKLLGENVRRL